MRTNHPKQFKIFFKVADIEENVMIEKKATLFEGDLDSFRRGQIRNSNF